MAEEHEVDYIDEGHSAEPNLNVLLASLAVFGMSVRGFHWNIVGPNFFDLHQAFGDLYDKVQLFMDEVAEQTRQHGQLPDHSFEAYLKKSKVGAAENFTDPSPMAQSLVDDLDKLMAELQAQILLAETICWFGMSTVLRHILAELQKQRWFFQSFVGEIG